MLYLIGLGLNLKGISQEGEEAVQGCDKVYLEGYTVNLPYTKRALEKEIDTEITELNREEVESDFLIKEAKNYDVALLVYGDPLSATTHISLVDEARKQGIKFKIVHATSIFDAICETGLQRYKYGKTASMPGFEADSFGAVILENKKIGAHSLILVDIGLPYEKALEKLEKVLDENGLNFGKILVCSRLGVKDSKIFYSDFGGLKGKEVRAPFCFIIPGKLHFLEEEYVKYFG